MRPHHLVLILAVLIAPGYSTSKAYVSKKMWSSSGCTGTATLIKDSYDDFWADNTCIPEAVATAGRRRTSGNTNNYRKVSCTANTASTGYTRTEYTDSACTAGASQTSAGSTDTCFGAGSEYEIYSCTTTSATVGAFEYGTYSAEGCADSELNGAGAALVNFCKQDVDSGAWSESSKYLIENGRFVKYKWTNSANKDCSGTGTAVVESGTTYSWTPGACQAIGTQWIKVSALIDGASIDGYSTLSQSGNSSDRKAMLNPIALLLAGLSLSFGFILQ